MAHTGSMVGLYPDPTGAAGLAMLGDEPAESLHLTVVYLGPAADLDDAARARYAAALAQVASSEQPIAAEISGLGHFDAAADNNDGMVPCVALVDGPGLGTLRVAVCEALGIDADGGDHDFQPHMSLAFHPPGQCNTGNPAGMAVQFTSIRLVAADETIADHPLAAEEAAMTMIETPATEAVTAGRWQAPNAILEGVRTGDRRIIDAGALSWRDLPMTLGWCVEDEGGHYGAVAAGSVDTCFRAGQAITAGGPFDSGEDGQELRRMIGEGTVNGISADITDATVLYEPDLENATVEADCPGCEGMLDIPYLERLTGGRIGGFTAVRIPAFEEARISLAASADRPGCYTLTVPVTWTVDDDGALVASVAAFAYDPPTEEAITAAAGTATAEVAEVAVPTSVPFATDGSVDLLHPPAEWFAAPDLDGPTPIVVTPEGRVYGHLAQFGVCHRGIQGDCVLAESTSADMRDFQQGSAVTAEGGIVRTGVLTVGTVHADLHLAGTPARDHYEHSGAAVAAVTAGRDAHGIWVAGALAPGATADQVWRLRSMTLSGDWRGRDLKLTAALVVPVGGFPKYAKALLASGEPMSLVSAGVIERPPLTGIDALVAAILDKTDRLETAVLAMQAERLFGELDTILG